MLGMSNLKYCVALQQYSPGTSLHHKRAMHTKARGPGYPGTSVKKCQVPDQFVKWSAVYDDYKPVEYTSDVVLKKPVWADPDIRY